MGLRRYLTHTPGIGGQLKLTPESFRVEEVSRYPVPVPGGRFTIAKVESVEIEQNELIRRLSSTLSLPPGAIRFAGSKDRRAITTQLLSIPVGPERLVGMRLSGVRILDSYTSADELYLGHLYGNRFIVQVSAISLPDEKALAQIVATERELRSQGGFPNYYGPQRFGEVRPVTHQVGRALLLGSVSEAIDMYLTIQAEGESPEGAEARKRYAGHHDPVLALKEFPPHLRFERTLLDRLARGDSAERAFHSMPRHLRTLFIHAYQSYLFNQLISLRLERGLPLGSPLEGDWLVRLGPDGLPGSLKPVEVSTSNVSEAGTLVTSGRARIAAPVVGTETPPAQGLAGEMLEQVMAEEGIKRTSFQIADIPQLSSAGTYRALLGQMPLSLFPGGVPKVSEGSITFSFCLEKGEYATVLLREFTKGPSLPKA